MKKTKIKLDIYEQGIEDIAERLVPVSAATKSKFNKIVERARKSKSISLRFNIHDLEQVKTKAAESGLPYQTLITMVMHKYVTNQFFEKNEIIKTLQLYKKHS